MPHEKNSLVGQLHKMEVSVVLSKNSMKERLLSWLVLAGIILVLMAILVFAVYSLQSFDFIQLQISSVGSAFAFMGLLLLGLGFLGMIGTLLDSLRKHLFKDRLIWATRAVQEILLIAIFGAMIYMIDQWIDGVELGNVQTEILLALFLYSLVTLLGRHGDQIKKQDPEVKKKQT